MTSGFGKMITENKEEEFVKKEQENKEENEQENEYDPEPKKRKVYQGYFPVVPLNEPATPRGSIKENDMEIDRDAEPEMAPAASPAPSLPPYTPCGQVSAPRKRTIVVASAATSFDNEVQAAKLPCVEEEDPAELQRELDEILFFAGADMTIEKRRGRELSRGFDEGKERRLLERLEKHRKGKAERERLKPLDRKVDWLEERLEAIAQKKKMFNGADSYVFPRPPRPRTIYKAQRSVCNHATAPS